MDDDTDGLDLSDLQPLRHGSAIKAARRCDNCRYSAKEQTDLVCRYNPPQVTFLIVPVPVTVGGPNGAQVRQGMQAVPHCAFPILRPELWCGRHEPKLS